MDWTTTPPAAPHPFPPGSAEAFLADAADAHPQNAAVYAVVYPTLFPRFAAWWERRPDAPGGQTPAAE